MAVDQPDLQGTTVCSCRVPNRAGFLDFFFGSPSSRQLMQLHSRIMPPTACLLACLLTCLLALSCSLVLSLSLSHQSTCIHDRPHPRKAEVTKERQRGNKKNKERTGEGAFRTVPVSVPVSQWPAVMTNGASIASRPKAEASSDQRKVGPGTSWDPHSLWCSRCSSHRPTATLSRHGVVAQTTLSINPVLGF